MNILKSFLFFTIFASVGMGLGILFGQIIIFILSPFPIIIQGILLFGIMFAIFYYVSKINFKNNE